jgi:hypothetical protein
MKLHLVKLKCNVQNEKGEVKPISTSILIHRAVNFTDAESETVKYFNEQAESEKYHNISSISVMLVENVLLTPDEPENPWFKIKISITDIDDKSSTTTYLIQEESMEKAQKKAKSLFINTSCTIDLKSSSVIKVHHYIELPEITEENENNGFEDTDDEEK